MSEETCPTCNGTGISWTSASGEEFECSDCAKGRNLRRAYESSAREDAAFERKYGYPRLWASGTSRYYDW